MIADILEAEHPVEAKEDRLDCVAATLSVVMRHTRRSWSWMLRAGRVAKVLFFEWPPATLTFMQPTAYEELMPEADDLLFFVDDTGHETFAGNQGYYGLGGCVVLGAGYAHLKTKWGEVRTVINGVPETRLHASMMERRSENFAALSEFFLDPSFVRVAVTTTKEVGLPPGMHPCVPVMGQLREEIAIVASLLPCKTAWIIVESSQRADPIVQSCFAQLTSLNVSRPVSVEHCFMPKSSNEPGLEVADFIVNAASSQIRRRLRGLSGPAPDFKDVFCRLPVEGCRRLQLVGGSQFRCRSRTLHAKP
jgi:hypothetical protein